MGLLEKALEKKQLHDTDQINQEEKIHESEIKIDTNIAEGKISEDILTTENFLEEKKKNNNNLFKKDKLKNQDNTQNSKQIFYGSLNEDEEKILYFHYKRQKVIEEKKGFGYNNLGSRRIVYNYDVNDFEYQVSEPVLTPYEKKVKKELSYLFKMLADVNISTMDKQEKKEYLENTLEQIIIDNDIKFYKKEKKKKSKQSSKGLFGSKKNKNEKHQKISNKKSTKNKNNPDLKQNKIANKKNKINEEKNNEKSRDKTKDPEGKTEKNKKISKIKLHLVKKEGKI